MYYGKIRKLGISYTTLLSSPLASRFLPFGISRQHHSLLPVRVRSIALGVSKPTVQLSLSYCAPQHSIKGPWKGRQLFFVKSMATTTRPNVTTVDTGILSDGVRADSAEVATKILQENLEKYHIFFNDENFHNHMVHHILTLYAMGGSPEDLKAAFERDRIYMGRPAPPVDEAVVDALGDGSKFKDHLNRAEHYSNFLVYFQREIDKKGVSAVVNEYVFAEDERAKDFLVRLFSGVIHPLIHLGFGIEFNQPAIVAEALAETAVHDNWIGAFLLPTEEAAGGIGKPGTKTLAELLDEIYNDRKLAESPQWNDPGKGRYGVLKRAPEEMVKYASQYTVSEDQLEEKLAEMINAVVYYTTTAQRPPKKIKFDFFYMHCVTSSIFLPIFLSQPWISTHAKIRLLEWKGRFDLFIYVSHGAPKLLLSEVTDYPIDRDWKGVFEAGISNARDDSHVVKMLRAVAYGERLCKQYEGGGGNKGFVITGDMWLKIGNMIVDSASGPETIWIRSAGFAEAWTEIPDRRS